MMYSVCVCLDLDNNEGRELYWFNMYPEVYISDLIYLEVTVAVLIPLVLMKQTELLTR